MLTSEISGHVNLHQINPYIRRAWYDSIYPGHDISERIIFDYELVYIKSGNALVTIEDDVYEATSGDIFFFKPRQRHSIRVLGNNPLVQPHVHFDLIYQDVDSAIVPISFVPLEKMKPESHTMIRPDITSWFFKDFPSYLRLKNHLHIEQLLFDLISAYNTSDSFVEVRLKWRFLRLFDQLLSEIGWMQGEHTSLARERANYIRLYLEQHTDRHITLEELAKIYHIDKSYISRIFQKAYGISPIRYHLLLRIEKAKNMIHYTNISLTSIANQTGFSTLADFSRAFRREEGVAPSSLRSNSK